MTMKHKTSQFGFTLIELSIVLVIIGLIVGGVLVGQDLIKAAEVRATVGQVEKWNAASNAFRSKYNGFPGDLPNPDHYFSGYTPCASAGRGCADGNRLIQSITNDGMDGEPAAFWSELAAANLIAETIDAAGLDFTADPDVVDPTLHIFPKSKSGKGNLFGVLAQNGLNYFIIGKPASGGTVSVIDWGIGLTPLEASQIDVKLDDGVAGTGTVISMASGTAPAPGTAADGSCANSGVYNSTTAAGGNTPNCVLSIRGSF